jgi:pimeloyl-ACP methyl ester carboxylesterase
MNVRVLLAVLLLGGLSCSQSNASKTAHPVVFAHGMGGFNNVLGFNYWGDDYGVFVGDSCNATFEFDCNPYLDEQQHAFIAQVQAFESSEVRGLDLADDIEGFMASVGVNSINIIGHSQGAIDARKAARLLYERRGGTVVDVLISVSGPHRGSPVARYILEKGPGVTNVLDTLATYYGNTVYEAGNDGFASTMQLIYDDFDPDDGKVTGMKAFNLAYPVDERYAARYLSVVTAQEGLSVNPALFLLNQFLFDFDGNGYCSNDCGTDGIAGMGDGVKNEADDDGVVGINSQQVGYRLNYRERLIFGHGPISTEFGLGFVGSVNEPTLEQATASGPVLHQDHLDVIGVGPDTFDELGFYAALITSISRVDESPQGWPSHPVDPSRGWSRVPALPVDEERVRRGFTP